MSANDYIECPVCGARKRQERNLVCMKCYQEFIEEAGKALASKGEIFNLARWAREKTETRLTSLRQELTEKEKEYSQLQEEVGDEAYQAIRSSLGGKIVQHDVFKGAFREKKKTLWGIRGGNKLHREKCLIEAGISFLEGFLKGIVVRNGNNHDPKQGSSPQSSGPEDNEETPDELASEVFLNP